MHALDWLSQYTFPFMGKTVSLAGVAAFVLALAGGFVLSAIIQSRPVRHFASRLGLDKNFVNLVASIVGLAVLVACAIGGLNLAGVPIDWNAPVPGIHISISKLLGLVGMLVVVFWLSSGAKRFLFNRYLSRMGADRALQYAIAQIIGYVVLIVGVVVVMQNAGVELSALAVFAGAVGVGLGFGLQNIARNFISGLVILAERPIKIGDRIEINKVAGRVAEIHARSTTIVTNDGIAIIVPNSDFIEKPIVNWSHGDPRVRLHAPVSVALGSDVPKVCESLLAVARGYAGVLSDPEPSVFLVEFGDNALNFELRVWTVEMSHRPGRFRSDLNFAIEKKFREAGIAMSTPQREVVLSGEVRMARPEGVGQTESAGGQPAEPENREAKT
jgi:small-conductance mechanosensitive channel